MTERTIEIVFNLKLLPDTWLRVRALSRPGESNERIFRRLILRGIAMEEAQVAYRIARADLER